MGIGSKIVGFLKESWEGMMSASPMNESHAKHRAGFGQLHNLLTGTNMPAAYERDDKPSLRK